VSAGACPHAPFITDARTPDDLLLMDVAVMTRPASTRRRRRLLIGGAALLGLIRVALAEMAG
jgi:hypothetical protein